MILACPFDNNNLEERDLRKFKIRLKVLGHLYIYERNRRIFKYKKYNITIQKARKIL